MREIVIRYMPKMLDRDFFQVYVPIRERLVPFNFFDKASTFKFAEDVIDGEFTEEEADSLFKIPSLPDKPRRERAVRQDSLPLTEREPGTWTPERRKRLFQEVCEKKPDGFSTGDLLREARKQGDNTTQATYRSMLIRLEKKDQVKMIPNSRPIRYIFQGDVNFRNSVPVVEHPPTHSQLRRIASAHTREEQS